MSDQDMHQKGLAIRKNMFGAEVVDKRIASAGEFGAPLQKMINQYAYGEIWGREALPHKTRSLLVLAMMCAANRPHELRIHLRGALKNGCTQDEIREVLLQVAIYCGIPASLDAHNMALEVFAEADKPPHY
ncbi:MAG: 4-carboxymuconolactone decarboxylase [Betaproteobacteria bacterium]|nr:4-carboxymuconolactone decarboxylase [Betaproteobacteria bacterium]